MPNFSGVQFHLRDGSSTEKKQALKTKILFRSRNNWKSMLRAWSLTKSKVWQILWWWFAEKFPNKFRWDRHWADIFDSYLHGPLMLRQFTCQISKYKEIWWYLHEEMCWTQLQRHILDPAKHIRLKSFDKVNNLKLILLTIVEKISSYIFELMNTFPTCSNAWNSLNVLLSMSKKIGFYFIRYANFIKISHIRWCSW